MTPKRTILESLTRTRLIELAYDFDADNRPTGRSKGELIDALARLRRTALETLLPKLSRDELKTACEALGLDSAGREKNVIIDRILGNGDGQATTKQRDAQTRAKRRGSNAATTQRQQAKISRSKRAKMPASSKSPGLFDDASNSRTPATAANGKANANGNANANAIATANGNGPLTLQKLESHLWGAADILRGSIDSSDYKHYIVVTPTAVELVAPVDRGRAEIEAFVHSRRRWVHDEREKMRESLATSPWPEHFVSGAKIPYRGRRMRLKVAVVPGNEIVTYYRNGFFVEVPKAIPSHERDGTIRHCLEMWLRRRVEDDAVAFVRNYARKLGQEPKAVRIKEQKHLWGSCGRDRVINLNWRLIFMPKPILEYAVVHELCHLKHRNHSPAFWNLLKSLLPNYEPRKLWLECNGAGFDL